MVLLLHRQISSRYVICQFVKKDLFNGLFWIVLVSISGVLNKSFDNQESTLKKKPSLSNSLDLTFVIKIFNNRYQKAHVNQETLGCLNFEKQLQMKIKVKKIIKSILITGTLSTTMKNILCENLAKDLTIFDSKIKLKHRGETSAINEQEFFQQNVEKKINNITKNNMLFTKRKATVNDPLDDLFENSFIEIYNKVLMFLIIFYLFIFSNNYLLKIIIFLRTLFIKERKILTLSMKAKTMKTMKSMRRFKTLKISRKTPQHMAISR